MIIYHFLLTLFSCILLVINSSSVAQVEGDGLCSFINSTNINSIHKEWYCTNSVPVGNYCNWTGITCENSRNVSSIVLRRIHLLGLFYFVFSYYCEQMYTMNFKITHVTNKMSILLIWINFIFKFISSPGEIPNDISKIIYLKTLNLRANSLAGPQSS